MKSSIHLSILLLLSLSLRAATNTAGSNSYADVNTAVGAAARGDTVLVPAGGGSVSWGSSVLTLTKGVNLIGPGRDALTISGSGQFVTSQPDATAIANEETIRIEGFTYDGSNTALNMVSVYGAAASGSKAFKNYVVGKNRFKNAVNTTSGSGAVLVHGQVRGCIYSNIFDRCNVILKVLGNDDTTEWSNGHYPFAYGNSDNLFFESNSMVWSSSYSGGDPGWTETGQGARLVIRYNTWDMANCSGTEIFDIHGFQNWNPGVGQTGTMITEYYGNSIVNASSYRLLNHRGGWGMFYNNVVSGSGGLAIEINQYALGDSGGSGCTVDVPGATGVYNAQVNNTYAFNNTINGTLTAMTPGSIGNGCGVSENNGYWNYNAGFDGSAGIGRGTTTPGGSPVVGVGYWKATTATPTTNSTITQAGEFYQCQMSGIWTFLCRPYTFPHPLVTTGGGGGGGGGGTTGTGANPGWSIIIQRL